MTATPHVHQRVVHHLHHLVEAIGARPPGSPANRRATTFAHGPRDTADVVDPVILTGVVESLADLARLMSTP